MLDIAGSWSAADAEGRSDDTVGSDSGCQSEENGSGDEGLGEHLNNECMGVGVECVFLKCETEVVMNIRMDHG